MNETGQRIKQAIRESQYTQADIAREMGVTPQAVNKWVRDGQITYENLEKLSDLTGKSITWIKSGSSSPIRFSAREPQQPYEVQDLDLMAEILEVIVEYRPSLPRERRKELAMAIYDYFKEEESTPNEAQIIRFADIIEKRA